jgi:hypothetical protein
VIDFDGIAMMGGPGAVVVHRPGHTSRPDLEVNRAQRGCIPSLRLRQSLSRLQRQALKVAAGQFPMFRFVLVKRVKGEWVCEEFRGAE